MGIPSTEHTITKTFVPDASQLHEIFCTCENAYFEVLK